MFKKSSYFAGSVLLAAALTGCAGNSGDYPSLALRPFERLGQPVSTADAAPASQPIRLAVPAVQLAKLRDAAAASHAAFVTQQTAAARLVRGAAGQPFESNARAAALVALAELDSRRAVTAGSLAAIDRIAAEAGAALSADPAIDAAQNEIEALVASEDAGITRLWASMGS